MKAILILCSLVATFGLAAAESPPLDIKRADDAIVINVGAQELLRYQIEPLKDSKLPVQSAGYFHPVRTLKGTVVTEVAPADHPHHRGIFLAWVEMHGKQDADFWGWGQHAPTKDRRIVNVDAKDLKSGKGSASFTAINHWMAANQVMIKEELRASVRVADRGYYLDSHYTLTPTNDLTLSQWAFSGFCVRTRKDGTLKAYGPEGEINLPNPKHTEPKSDWPDTGMYSYVLSFADGKKARVAVYNDPENPPTLWHNHRDVRMLNPCIVAPAPVKLSAGKPFRLKYRVEVSDN